MARRALRGVAHGLRIQRRAVSLSARITGSEQRGIPDPFVCGDRRARGNSTAPSVDPLRAADGGQARRHSCPHRRRHTTRAQVARRRRKRPHLHLGPGAPAHRGVRRRKVRAGDLAAIRRARSRRAARRWRSTLSPGGVVPVGHDRVRDRCRDGRTRPGDVDRRWLDLSTSPNDATSIRDTRHVRCRRGQPRLPVQIHRSGSELAIRAGGPWARRARVRARAGSREVDRRVSAGGWGPLRACCGLRRRRLRVRLRAASAVRRRISSVIVPRPSDGAGRVRSARA